MSISLIVIIILLIIGTLLIVGSVLLRNNPDKIKQIKVGVQGISTESVISSLNDNKFVQDFGNRFTNIDKLDELFRKSKNPWNLTPFSYNFIRYGGLIIGLVCALAFYFLAWQVSLIFLFVAGVLYIYPKQRYESTAKSRESQWNQVYQFIWVIKHNLTESDPKRTWFSVEEYIKQHAEDLTELIEGFHDFGAHWNGKDMDAYIKQTYGDFDIPKNLFSVVLQSEITGEFPNDELNSLRQLIVQKMNFHVQDILATVGAKATLISTPFLLVSVMLVVLIPVGMQLLSSFGG